MRAFILKSRHVAKIALTRQTLIYIWKHAWKTKLPVASNFIFFAENRTWLIQFWKKFYSDLHKRGYERNDMFNIAIGSNKIYSDPFCIKPIGSKRYLIEVTREEKWTK